MNTISMVHVVVMLAATSAAEVPDGLAHTAAPVEPMRVAAERPPTAVQQMAPDRKTARVAGHPRNDDGLSSDQVYRPVRKAVRTYRISAADCTERMHTGDGGKHWSCEFNFTAPPGGTRLYLRNEVQKVVRDCTTGGGRSLQCPVTATITLERVFVSVESRSWQDSSGLRWLAELTAGQARSAFGQFFAAYPQLTIPYLKEE